jgi:glutamate synthase domain-containing protein 2
MGRISGGKVMRMIRLMFAGRRLALTAMVLLSIACLGLAFVSPYFLLPLPVTAGLAALGFRDLSQRSHSILRNYPILAHIRFLLEKIRPEIRQYFLESEMDGAPFSRKKRSIVYQRAKGQLDKLPFGTQLDVYSEAFEWVHHSIAPAEPAREAFRVVIGGPQCAQPYSASVFNISAMSFGALSANAITALNRGARLGRFAHDTGEGGLSRYHREGGDVIWELGSGYFGCRTLDGKFSAEEFARTAVDPAVKMIEIKLSQGAKPGHGGVLPGAKVSPEIAATRGVPQGKDCISPSRHSAFSTPIELLQFIAELRGLSGGKPVGFKLCLGHPWEFLAICKAMLATDILPDFIVVDGTEGGTGAAPLEFVDHIGMPLRDGLNYVHNALVGIGKREHIRIGASGKVTSAFDMARAMALGADWCNSARGFMFALGCIQSLSCHTDKCPTGVATQDPHRQKALDVPNKATRVAQFHRSTVKALTEVVAAAGLEHPNQFRPHHFFKRVSSSEIKTYADFHRPLDVGELLAGTEDPRFKTPWAMASAETFAPSIVVNDQRGPAAAPAAIKEPIIVAPAMGAAAQIERPAPIHVTEPEHGDAR